MDDDKLEALAARAGLDAHAAEEQAETMLKGMASRIRNYPELKTRIEQHITESQRQALSFGFRPGNPQVAVGAPIAINKEGNTVTVRAHSSKRESFWNFGRSRTEGHYTLRVPRNSAADLRTAGGGIATSELRGEVKAKTSGGKLKFEHVEGPVVGETNGGSIEVRACNGAIEIETSGGEIATEDSKGGLHARTSGGGIHVRNFSGDTEVKTSGGELTLDRIAGKLTGKTSGGSISASVVGSVMGDVTLETSAGSIDLVLPANAAVDIAAETSAGRITSNLPLLLGKPDHEHLHGKLNGGGKTVLLRTSAGSITIDAGSPETAAL